MNYFSKYWPHSIALLLGLALAFIFEPHGFEKYKGELLSKQWNLLAEGQKVFYVDLNNDGDSEEFIYYHLSENKQPVVNQYSSSGDFEHIWYLEGKVVKLFDLLSGDYNSDGKNELYLFSVDNAGLYLYGIDGTQSNLFTVEKTLITSINELNKENQLVIRPAGLFDLNNDGFKEAIFSVSNRYNPTPRRVFAYDIKNDNVYSSPEMELQLVGTPNVFDIDDDGEFEVFISTLNSINYTASSLQTSSLRSKSIVLDSKLQFKFSPYNYSSKMSVSSALPVANAKKKGYLSLNWTLAESKEAKLALFSSDGRLEKEIFIEKESFVFDQSREDWTDIRTFSYSGLIRYYNQNLQLLRTINVGSLIKQVDFVDIDKDGIEELLLVKDNSLLICQNDFSTRVEIHIPGLGAQKLLFSVKENSSGSNQLSIQNQIYQYRVDYYKNPTFWMHYVWYFLVSILALGCFVLLKYLLNKYIEFVRKKERESTYMHIDLVKNQLDPHFLFNALNSIAYSVNKDDKKTAYRNIGIFSKFLREAIVSIDDYGRSLEDELNFIKYYLELEKFRFKEKFEYDILISPKVSKLVKIPKMCIFSYVESALKKGVLPKEEGGNIEINVDVTSDNILIIRIVDDGLHRGLEIEKGNTKSMQVMERSIKFYNQLNMYPIEVTYTDKGTSDKPKGSLVELRIPMDFNYD